MVFRAQRIHAHLLRESLLAAVCREWLLRKHDVAWEQPLTKGLRVKTRVRGLVGAIPEFGVSVQLGFKINRGFSRMRLRFRGP